MALAGRPGRSLQHLAPALLFLLLTLASCKPNRSNEQFSSWLFHNPTARLTPLPASHGQGRSLLPVETSLSVTQCLCCNTFLTGAGLAIQRMAGSSADHGRLSGKALKASCMLLRNCQQRRLPEKALCGHYMKRVCPGAFERFRQGLKHSQAKQLQIFCTSSHSLSMRLPMDLCSCCRSRFCACLIFKLVKSWHNVNVFPCNWLMERLPIKQCLVSGL